MNVYPTRNICFHANYFKVKKYAQDISVHVMTDNAENLGTKPVCKTKFGTEQMIYDGKYYTTKSKVNDNIYKIKYIDTAKYENQGQEKEFNYDKILNLVKEYEPPINLALSKGCAKGLLIQAKDINEKILESKFPLIVLCENQEECLEFLNNANGIILKSAFSDFLSHFSAICREYFSLASLITDENILKELSSYEGKFISISNVIGLDYKEIPPIKKEEPKFKNKIKIPKLDTIDTILSIDKCEQNLVGNKAYNLKILKKLAVSGVLDDVNIPNAFVLPHSYLKRIENLIDKNRDYYYQTQGIKELDEIKNFISKNLTQKRLIARSAFNGEDLEGYSAAGLYKSLLCNSDNFYLGTIYEIIKSKNSTLASKSRLHYGISDEDIQPSVIIQDYINTDYSFTTYTESPFDKNKLLIELFINNENSKKSEPIHINYNRITEKLTIEKNNSVMEFVFNENYDLLSRQSINLFNIESMLPILKKIVKNALILEKELGKPQDIEGGIKNSKLFLWQTRNIIKSKI